MSTGGDSSNLASSMTDLMTSLAVIFILLLVASLNNAQQEGEDTRNQMVVELQQAFREFEAHGVRVESDPRDPLSLLVLVPERILVFEFDKSDILPQGLIFLRQFAPQLAEVACSAQFRKEINSITVEGHADSPGTDEANLERSQQRSSAVVMEILGILATLGNEDPARQGMRECFKSFASATGRGSVDPVLGPDGEEDKDRSRRVVFKIRIRSIEQRELREIIGGGQSAAMAK